MFGIGLNGVNPDLRLFTLIGAITFVVVMVIGGGATLWGPIVGAFVYVLVENRTREWGAESAGIVGVLFGWLNGSPATFILAIVLLVLMFVAPFGIVGLLKRLAAKVVVVVPRPAGTRSNVPPVEEGLDPSIDEPFLPAIHRGDSMTSRSTRVLAVAGASVLAFSVAGLGHAGAGSEEGWTVDTEDCSDPDRANAPIEGTIRIGSAMPLSGGAAAAAFEPAAPGLEAYINYANENDLVPGYELELTDRRRPVRPGADAGRRQRADRRRRPPLRRDHRHAEQPRRARHAQRGVHPAAQRARRRSPVR